MPISGFIKSLKDKQGNYIFPETSSEAVYCPDGKTLEDKFTDIDLQLERIFYDIRFFGAKNDGVTDNSIIFNNIKNSNYIEISNGE